MPASSALQLRSRKSRILGNRGILSPVLSRFVAASAATWANGPTDMAAAQPIYGPIYWLLRSRPHDLMHGLKATPRPYKAMPHPLHHFTSPLNHCTAILHHF